MPKDAKAESESAASLQAPNEALARTAPMSGAPHISWWQQLSAMAGRFSRATRFLFAATITVGLTMAFVGNLISQQIKLAAAQSAGEGAAIYMEAYLSEHIQGLASARTLPDASKQAIDKLMSNTSLKQHVVSVKIWLPDGSNVYSTRELPANQFYPSESIAQAMQGKIVTSLSELDQEEHAYEHSLNIPLYETYVPLRELGSGRVLAAGEFYEMEHEIGSIHQEVWATIAAASIAMLILLFCIVRHGDRIIERQQIALRQQMHEQDQLHQQNTALQDKITSASHEFSTITELTLRRLGADLHDGPAQLLTLILLRIDELSGLRERYLQEGENPSSDALETIRSAAQDSLREIRGISRGLALPEINVLSLHEELQLVVQRHELRTESKVKLSLGNLPSGVPLPYKICIYRLVQEALNNAFHHAGGKQQQVSASYRGGLLEVQIEDAGAGISAEALQAKSRGRSRLGLVGMRYRVESLGGRFSIESAPEHGTRIKAQFNMAAADSDNS
ncbi:ATP-binding protein [Pseudomonas sp. sp1636]|nr:ATP-binding protein [Pseudomonas sp. sp1636]